MQNLEERLAELKPTGANYNGFIHLAVFVKKPPETP